MTRNLTAEERLTQGFAGLVAGLHLPELMVPVAGRTVAHPELFRLTPVEAHGESQSLAAGGYTAAADPSVRTHHEEAYLDTRQAIGLVYDDYLIAVGGAGIDKKGNIFIKQLQDVTGIRKYRGREFYKTGLHNGFSWRDTLVRGWEEIGTSLECPAVIIQSDGNNKWSRVNSGDGHAYNEVASRMGYAPMADGNWMKSLAGQE